MIVSCGRMSPSSNQRRAIPVVTMMTFHVGVSGVASRSRFTTPTFSSGVRSISSAIGRMASVLPVPVPATMPKPLPPRASSRTRAPCSRSRKVSMWSCTASSIVSQAARVGAMTMTRPVGGSAATNASCSGTYLSRTARIARDGVGVETDYSGGRPGRIAGGFTPVKPFAPGGSLTLSPCLVLLESE